MYYFSFLLFSIPFLLNVTHDDSVLRTDTRTLNFPALYIHVDKSERRPAGMEGSSSENKVFEK
jgi:hypothetical protein